MVVSGWGGGGGGCGGVWEYSQFKMMGMCKGFLLGLSFSIPGFFGVA